MQSYTIIAVLIPAFVSLATANSRCPSDWQYFQDSNTCLKGYTRRGSYQVAWQTCNRNHGMLVKVDSLAKNSIVRTLLDPDVNIWIGVWDEEETQSWTYVDGSPLTYTNWKDGQPDNSQNREACAHIWKDNGGKWNDANCGNDFQYVCEIPAEELDERCQEDWHHYDASATCLRGFSTKEDFTSAREICISHGGDLVTVEDLYKNDFVRIMFDGDKCKLRIGVWDSNHNGTWTQADGSPLTYTNWETGQPDNYENQEACGHMWGGHRGKWADGNCNDPMRYVCEMPELEGGEEPEQEEPPCEQGWFFHPASDSCITGYEQKLTFIDARVTCQDDGAELVIIDSLEKNGFVRALVPDESIWIGLWDEFHTEQWTYVDGSPVTYSNWRRGEPNNRDGREACGHIWKGRGGKWNDDTCDRENIFVCEKPAGTRVTTTAFPIETTTEIVEPTTEYIPPPEEWPKGKWGLVQAGDSCPDFYAFKMGQRYQDTEDDDNKNRWSQNFGFAGKMKYDGFELHYCSKTKSASTAGTWQPGNYCIHRVGNKCPARFQEGFLKWDNEDSYNANTKDGYLPSGSYNKDTEQYFCCRNDSMADIPIDLPVTKPFYLYKYTSDCQKVRGMTATPQAIHYDDENEDNTSLRGGAHPADDGGPHDHCLHYCLYTAK